MQNAMPQLAANPEPTANRDQVVGRLAWSMKFVGIFLFILGLCSIANGINEAAGQKNWGAAFQWAGPGVMWLSLGMNSVLASRAFKASVKAGPEDAMTRALEHLRRFFLVLTVFAFISIGILTVNLVLALTHAH